MPIPFMKTKLRWTTFPLEFIYNRHRILERTTTVWLYIYYLVKCGRPILTTKPVKISYKDVSFFCTRSKFFECRNQLLKTGFIITDSIIHREHRIKCAPDELDIMRRITGKSINSSTVSIEKRFLEKALTYFSNKKALKALQLYYYFKQYTQH